MEDFYFLSFFAGVLIAMMVTLTGIGGGILWSPFLMVVYKFSPEKAITTALFIQMVGMLGGAYQYLRSGRVDIRLALLYTAFALPMVVLGSFLGERVGEKVLTVSLGLVAIGVAVLFISGDDWYGEEVKKRAEIKTALRYGVVPLVTSVLSGMLSVGVGDFIVPVMVKKLKLSMEVAIGTALAIMFVVVAFGAFSHLLFEGSASWPVLLWAAGGVLLGGFLGSNISERINDAHLRELFIFILLFIGIHMIYTGV
ncbi:MAG: sulfite exporter TauE/SafE family protein [Deltaproteobacteria bacterium]|uniref:Probable membrane transporter protein n=1 Tax=Candidatus Zymogenus saltonus TaxID=2844893 RepID=A0A9D8KEU6_9DELT|nr:sulfite exporter TauE/SafE family protein [Candidatus Zymogenus saltonus]